MQNRSNENIIYTNKKKLSLKIKKIAFCRAEMFALVIFLQKSKVTELANFTIMKEKKKDIVYIIFFSDFLIKVA